MKMNTKKNEGFFQVPEYFHDYGLQVFTHIEYDLLHYILRNTIGWNRNECIVSIKKIALIKHYSEKNIITTINNLIDKTGVFNKVVYREKGSCIKKTKYFINENSVKLLNDYVEKNIPADFWEREKAIENRSKEAEKRLQEGKEKLLEKQKGLLQALKNDTADITETNNQNDTEMTDEKKEHLLYQLDAIKEIINDYDPDECWQQDTFKEYKEYMYQCYLCYVPEETNDDKIDIRISDLINLTNDKKTINFYNTLIKNKRTKKGDIEKSSKKLKK
ncbi:hypothetical protein FACS189483_10420 [Spirochaetia bacterium]|nr:hypothetical protein FACS189483_10420 [Spirochaetia bacterium]